MKKLHLIEQDNGLFISDNKQHFRPWWVNGIRVERCIEYFQSDYQFVEFWQTSNLGILLGLNGCIQMCEHDAFAYHEMVVHVPMQVHPRPRHVLIVGDGDGGSVSEVCKYKSVETITWVDIDRQVVAACSSWYASQFRNHDMRVEYLDENGYTVQLPRKYDVIIWGIDDDVTQEGDLDTSAYNRVADLLAPGGIAIANVNDPWPDKYLFDISLEAANRVFGNVGFVWSRFPSWSQTGDMLIMSDEPAYSRYRVCNNPELPQGLRWYDHDYHKAALKQPRAVFRNGVSSIPGLVPYNLIGD
ncbi:MAG: spermidine synthase [Gammaproteobacteria bacterium]|nr:spermidine synthase [Gammaproteobacteria bacterium]